jgi:hypothetical protein
MRQRLRGRATRAVAAVDWMEPAVGRRDRGRLARRAGRGTRGVGGPATTGERRGRRGVPVGSRAQRPDQARRPCPAEDHRAPARVSGNSRLREFHVREDGSGDLACVLGDVLARGGRSSGRRVGARDYCEGQKRRIPVRERPPPPSGWPWVA